MRTELLLAYAAMTAATIFSRALFTVSVSRVRFPPLWERYLSFIPFAVLAAMVAPYLFLPGNGQSLSLLNPWTLAGGLTFAVSFRTRNLILAAGSGVVLFAVLGGMG